MSTDPIQHQLFVKVFEVHPVVEIHPCCCCDLNGPGEKKWYVWSTTVSEDRAAGCSEKKSTTLHESAPYLLNTVPDGTATKRDATVHHSTYEEQR
jgi:hypothetical protein